MVCQLHTYTMQKLETLPENVEKQKVVCQFYGSKRMLVHSDCYNGELLSDNLIGLIQHKKKGAPYSDLDDSPENFYHQCCNCGETFNIK